MGKADCGQKAGEAVAPEWQVGAAPLRARASCVLGRGHVPPSQPLGFSVSLTDSNNLKKGLSPQLEQDRGET